MKADPCAWLVFPLGIGYGTPPGPTKFALGSGLSKGYFDVPGPPAAPGEMSFGTKFFKSGWLAKACGVGICGVLPAV